MEPFTERQKFKQWWIWVILGAAVIVPVLLTIWNVQKGVANETLNEIIYGACGPGAIAFMFTFLRLDSRVDAEGVWYRFFPFQFSLKLIPWSDLDKAYIRTYSPLAEYGGWGIRFGMGGNGMAYNIAGKIGLQLVRKNGKRILIGTQDANTLTAYLEQLVKLKHIERKVITP